MSGICGCGNVTDSDYGFMAQLTTRAGGVSLAQFVKDAELGIEDTP
jgi:hypothetical protein